MARAMRVVSVGIATIDVIQEVDAYPEGMDPDPRGLHVVWDVN
jgi:hypothetical protein